MSAARQLPREARPALALADLQRDLDRLPTEREILALHDALDAARCPRRCARLRCSGCATCEACAPCVLHDALISEGRDG